MYQSKFAQEKRDKEREESDTAKAKLEALNLPKRMETYRKYRDLVREMENEYRDEDDYVSRYGRLPEADDEQYKAFKLKRIRDPTYEEPSLNCSR